MIPVARIASPARSESAAQSSPRPRTAVTALPRAVLALSVPAETALDSVSEFLDGLVELPVASWLTIGRALMADREQLAVRQAAWSEVEEAIAAHNLAPAAWEVREALETAVFLVSRPVQCWSREERCQFAATHGAAEAAALALRARAHVRPETARTLCSPFAPFLGFSSLLEP
jgi:hypothetical protein